MRLGAALAGCGAVLTRWSFWSDSMTAASAGESRIGLAEAPGQDGLFRHPVSIGQCFCQESSDLGLGSKGALGGQALYRQSTHCSNIAVLLV